MAQGPPTGEDAFDITSEAFRVRADIDLDAVYQRLLNETRRLLTDFQQQGLSGSQLADAVLDGLQSLSPGPVESIGRSASTEAFNLGRNVAAQKSADQIGRVIRTEILDTATCDPCRDLDGFQTTVNGPGYFENMPPNKCDGRELCRGFYLYEAA